MTSSQSSIIDWVDYDGGKYIRSVTRERRARPDPDGSYSVLDLKNRKGIYTHHLSPLLPSSDHPPPSSRPAVPSAWRWGWSFTWVTKQRSGESDLNSGTRLDEHC